MELGKYTSCAYFMHVDFMAVLHIVPVHRNTVTSFLSYGILKFYDFGGHGSYEAY